MKLPLGKQRCKILKEIRQRIAEENDIAFITSECKHQGDCAGTCPKCEAELRYLEKELEARKRLGKAVTVAGLAVTVALSAPSCREEQPLGGEPTVDSSVFAYAGSEAPEYESDDSADSGVEYAGEPAEYDYSDEVTAGVPTIEDSAISCSDEELPQFILSYYTYFEYMSSLILPDSEQKHTVIQDDENGKLTESIVTILDGRVLRVLHKPFGEQEEITEVTVLHND